MAEFFNRTTLFVNNESSGTKAKRSMGAKYGDEAVGKVQVKKTSKSSHVLAEVTPEHKINTQAYIVSVNIDLRHQKIVNAQCKGCVAALGGCKHAIAVVGWLHRRSEEPSPTEEKCYWKKSALATIDPSKPYDSDATESSTYTDSEEDDSDGFVNSFAAECASNNIDCHFLHHYDFNKFANPLLKLSLHHLMFDFVHTKQVDSPNIFIKYCSQSMDRKLLQNIVIETKSQYKSSLWRELRYGRITGSVAHEVANCKTKDGSTMDKLFGKKFFDTKAMKRGRELEPCVKLAVEKLLGEKITDTGLWLQSELPIFGASPDGIGPKNKYCVEIKCPLTKESYKNYILRGGTVGKKYIAQVQLQMHLTKIKKTKFCVADPEFEANKKVEIVDIDYDETYVVKEVIEPCTKYWMENVYKKIRKVVE
ncbi:hypothetical protein HA402_009064 [Bradysia odoriphaga]|nr:hypothetical protein HA402_009064 [Bradysia odoriphaga]